MSGLNLIGPRLMNTLMKLVFVSEAWILTIMNPNPNPGNQP
jgi:hypothetical protein